MIAAMITPSESYAALAHAREKTSVAFDFLRTNPCNGDFARYEKRMTEEADALLIYRIACKMNLASREK